MSTWLGLIAFGGLLVLGQGALLLVVWWIERRAARARWRLSCDHTIYTVGQYGGSPGTAGPGRTRCACGRYSLADHQRRALELVRIERTEAR